MTEAQIRSVALFFFFAFSDKSVAYQASAQAIQYIKKKNKNSNEPLSNAIIVFATHKFWKKWLKKKSKDNKFVSDQGWILPTSLKLEQWWQFSKESEPILTLTLIWSYILEISDKDIAEGLGVTEGTVRYRAGKSLKHLGNIQPPLGASL